MLLSGDELPSWQRCTDHTDHPGLGEGEGRQRLQSPSVNLINFLPQRTVGLIKTFTKKFGSCLKNEILRYQLTALTVSIVFFPVK